MGLRWGHTTVTPNLRIITLIVHSCCFLAVDYPIVNSDVPYEGLLKLTVYWYYLKAFEIRNSHFLTNDGCSVSLISLGYGPNTPREITNSMITTHTRLKLFF